MNKPLAILFLLTAIGAAAWFGTGQQRRSASADAAGDGASVTHVFEAEDVVLRQMDGTGRLQYEVAAERIVQLSDGGTIEASKLTLHHDPRGASPDGSGRWTLTAAEGEFSAGDQVVALSGNVRATGIPTGRSTPVLLTSDSLRYDLASEEFSTDAQVEFVMGRYKARGGLLRGNVATNEWALELGVHGTISR